MTPQEQDRQPDAETFRPLRLASPAGRAFTLFAGPIIWIIALIVLAEIVREGRAVGVGLLLFFGSLLLGFIYLIPQRRIRERRERERRKG